MARTPTPRAKPSAAGPSASTRAAGESRAPGESRAAGPQPIADPLVIRDLQFLGGMAVAGGWRPPEALPEVAFIGRSNVGKSSLLNLLVRRRAFARVSRTPGRTQEVNFFQVNRAFILVDLPGYGYARVSKTRRHSWQPLIDGYLRMTAQLRGIVLLLDVRREPNDEDLAMVDYLAELEVPTLIVITKVDKLRRGERQARIAAITAAIGVDPSQVIASSAHDGQGRQELAEAVVQLITQPAWRPGGAHDPGTGSAPPDTADSERQP